MIIILIKTSFKNQTIKMKEILQVKPTTADLLVGLILACSVTSTALAEENIGFGANTNIYANPSAHQEERVDVNTNNQDSQDWSIHLQTTHIEQRKNNFYSPYSSINSAKGNTSLLSRSEGDTDRSFTFTTTAFLGTRLWRGAEFYYNPELFEGTPFSGALVGLGGFQNGELQKGNFIPAITYNARAFIRQTIGFGGGDEYIPEGTVNQLAGTVDKNRLVLTWGKVASQDFFDMNEYSHDPRIHFMNFSVFSMAAYGYAADSRGYTYGFVGELFRDDWTFKAARLAAPTIPNQLEIDNTLTKDYVDQFEITHKHRVGDQVGAIRGLIFKQQAYLSTYQDAIAYAQNNLGSGAPNIYNTRKMNTMFGYGLNAEQSVNSALGVFTRWSWNNNQTETNTLDVGRSAAAGMILKGILWDRKDDTYGLAWAANAISSSEISYLQLGGQTMFIGDGALQYKPEQIFETYYSAKLYKELFLTADFQKITNPAYNSARGPINVISVRLHFEL